MHGCGYCQDEVIIRMFPRQLRIAAILPFSRLCKECLCAHGGAASSFWGCQLISPNPRIFLSSDPSLHSPPLTSVPCLANQRGKAFFGTEAEASPRVLAAMRCLLSPRICGAGWPQDPLSWDANEEFCWSSRGRMQAVSPALGRAVMQASCWFASPLPLGCLCGSWLYVPVMQNQLAWWGKKHLTKNLRGLRWFQWCTWQFARESSRPDSYQCGYGVSKPCSHDQAASRLWTHLCSVYNMPKPPGTSVTSLGRLAGCIFPHF